MAPGMTRPASQVPDPAAVVAAVTRHYRRNWGPRTRQCREGLPEESAAVSRRHGARRAPPGRRSGPRRESPSWPTAAACGRWPARSYATDFHDLRSTGIALLERREALLAAADLPWLCDLVRRSANWAHVDWLVTKVVGPIIARAPGRRPPAHAASLGPRSRLLGAPGGAAGPAGSSCGPAAGTSRCSPPWPRPMLPEKEFFIRKAIGWVLREVGHRRPQLAFEFLRAHRAQAVGPDPARGLAAAAARAARGAGLAAAADQSLGSRMVTSRVDEPGVARRLAARASSAAAGCPAGATATETRSAGGDRGGLGRRPHGLERRQQPAAWRPGPAWCGAGASCFPVAPRIDGARPGLGRGRGRRRGGGPGARRCTGLRRGDGHLGHAGDGGRVGLARPVGSTGGGGVVAGGSTAWPADLRVAPALPGRAAAARSDRPSCPGRPA